MSNSPIKDIITPNSKLINLQEIKQYRDLFFILARRDFKVRYAQTVLGTLWAFIQPLVTLAIYAFLFGKVLEVDTKGVPYPVFAMAALAPWVYFSFVFNNAGASLVTSQSLITKVYFPRLIIPFAKSLVGIADLVISVVLLILLLLITGHLPSVNIIYLPILVFILFITSLGVGVWVSALTVRFRDLQLAVPFILQLGAYVTPVGYPSDLIPEKYLVFYYMNPLAGLCEAVRWSITGYGSFSSYNYISFAVGGLIFITSFFYFARINSKVADII